MKKETWLLIALFAGVLLLWFSAWTWIEHSLPPEKGSAGTYETRGQFGDMFGAINSLFSALAFAGVIYTLILQTKEIQEQRKEQNKNEELRNRQMEFFTKQIQYIEGQIQINRQKTRPVFHPDGGSGDHQRRYLKFINKGGAIPHQRHKCGF